MGCEETFLKAYAGISKFKEWIFYSPKEQCWRWLPHFKYHPEVHPFVSKFGFLHLFDASNKSVTIFQEKTPDRLYNYQLEDYGEEYGEDVGKPLFLSNGEKVVIAYLRGHNAVYWSFVIVDLSTMEEKVVHSNIKDSNNDLKPLMNKNKLFLIKYSVYGDSEQVLCILDLHSGVVELRTNDFVWEGGLDVVCAEIVLDKLFLVVMSGNLDDPPTDVDVLYYDESTDQWNSAAEVPVTNDPLSECLRSTSQIQVKAMGDKLYIMHHINPEFVHEDSDNYDTDDVSEYDFDLSELHKSGPCEIIEEEDEDKYKNGLSLRSRFDCDDDKSWFLHVLKVSEVNGIISCSWEHLFSKVKDSKGNFFHPISRHKWKLSETTL